MPNLHELEAAIPVAPLKLIVLDSAVMLGKQVTIISSISDEM